MQSWSGFRCRCAGKESPVVFFGNQTCEIVTGMVCFETAAKLRSAIVRVRQQAELFAKQAKRGCVVYVVPHWQKVDWQIDFGSALDGVREDVSGAPRDALE